MCRAACVMLILLGASQPASEVNQLVEALTRFKLEQAQKEFQAGVSARDDVDKARAHFAESASLYDRLRREGCTNPALYRNLGNAHLLADQLAEAIFVYRHGLDRFGHEPRLFENLDYARQLVPYPADRGRPASRWPAWLPRPTPGQLLVIAACLYALACVCLTRWLMTRRGSLLAMAAGCGLLALLAGGTWGWDVWQRQQQPALVVISAESLPLRKGNGPSYPPAPDMPTVYRGMEARRVGERGGWVQIEFASGDAGWVPREAVLIAEREVSSQH